MNMIIKTLLITIAVIFTSCGENTKQAAVTDIASIKIDDGDISIYSTDSSKILSASATYTDGTTAQISDPDMWTNSNYDVLSMYNGVITTAANGGSALIEINAGRFSDEINVTVIKLIDFNISNADINTTGEYYTLEATGLFEDNSSKVLERNIIWSADNGATIIYEDNVSKISLVSGDTNVTATVFAETNTSSQLAPVSKIYSIN